MSSKQPRYEEIKQRKEHDNNSQIRTAVDLGEDSDNSARDSWDHDLSLGRLSEYVFVDLDFGIINEKDRFITSCISRFGLTQVFNSSQVQTFKHVRNRNLY